MLDLTQTIATLVLDHSEIAPVLQRHRLDFCCRGNVTLDVACAERGLDADVVAAELNRAVAARATGHLTTDPRSLSTPRLVAHIIAQYHEPLRTVLPFLQGLSAKVARVHGDHNARLRPLGTAVAQLATILPVHLDVEENTLFPALVSPAPERAVVETELRAMHTDHLAVGELLRIVRAESEDFTSPEWACNSYRTLMTELLALETAILAHVHLENHVLMPRFM